MQLWEFAVKVMKRLTQLKTCSLSQVISKLAHYKYKQSLGSNRPMSNITKALANVKYKSRTGEIRFASVQVAREVQAVNAAAVIGSLQRF